MSAEEISKIIATVFIVGFAIQQLMQIFDPLTEAISACLKDKVNGQYVFGSTTTVSLKKSVVMIICFIVGLLVSVIIDFRLLDYIKLQADSKTIINPCVNHLIMALVFASGTEAVNTVIKYFTYIKDAKSFTFDSAVSMSIIPQNVSLKVGEKAVLLVQSLNTHYKEVDWMIVVGEDKVSMNVQKEQATFIALLQGTCTILAINKADRTKVATATLNISQNS